MMKKMFFTIVTFISLAADGQTIQPDLHDKSIWQTIGRTAELKSERNRKIVYLDEGDGGGLYVYKNYSFTEGIIEFDVKGRDLDHKSFVGLAFHIQNDSTYESVYFRPFNFHNTDTIRRSRAVQYVSVPGNDWSHLRDHFPGKYERRVPDAPKARDWFHVKIIIKEKSVSVYVNGSSHASLDVETLSNFNTGSIGFLTGTNSDGSFANLKISPLN